jgi:hypothetical protein
MKEATAIPMVTKAAGRKEGRKEGQWVLCVVAWCVYKLVYHPKFLTV